MEQEKKILINLINPLIFHRYLYLLVKFFSIEGYKILFVNDSNQCNQIRKNNGYINLILSEKRVCFQSSFNQKVELELNDDILSPDYFSFLLKNSQDSFYIPMSLHPLMYHKALWNLPIAKFERKKSIFMVGNFDKKSYKKNENKPFAVKGRIEIYQYLKNKNKLTFFKSKTEFDKFCQSDLDNKCILVDRNVFAIPMEDLRNILGKFRFFLALPGFMMPYSHNVIEAISVGTIPIIQKTYAEMFHPPLEHMNNAIFFEDFSDLLVQINESYKYSEDKLEFIRLNVLKYYKDNLTPKSVVKKILNNSAKKIYLQAEQNSVKLLEQNIRMLMD